jgi:hypothetical protein
MTVRLLSVLLASLPALSAHAQRAAPLRPELAGLAFLLGSWTGQGKVADTHGTATGISKFTSEAGGTVILRRDHTDLQDGAGHPIGGFDQIMTIYAAGPAVRAEYFDPNHMITYTNVTINPEKSVTFSTAPGAGPTFRLTYTLQPGNKLGVDFAMAPPGSPAFHDIAAGTLQRSVNP